MTLEAIPAGSNGNADPPSQALTMVTPLVNGAEALAAWNAFQDIKRSLVTANDVQHISGRDFTKKSGYLKIAAAFGVNTEIIATEKDDLVDEHGRHYFQWRLTVRATAPNGRYMEAVGACASNERKFAHADADVFAQAQTRATNRAISNLVGGGEVSAEEMRAEHAAPPISREQAAAVTEKFLDAIQEHIGEFDWHAITECIVMARGDLRQAYRLIKAQYPDGAEPEDPETPDATD